MTKKLKTKTISTYGRSPRSLQVVFKPKLEDLNSYVDWSNWYITDEDAKARYKQALNVRMLLSCLYEWAEEQSWDEVLIGANRFFSWVQEHPMVRVSPDVYLLDQPPKPLPANLRTWLPGHRPPRLAFEFINKKGFWRKNYQDIPSKYAQLGTKELVIFDHRAVIKQTKNRFPLQIFRRTADNIFYRIYSGYGPARCEELNAWLVVKVEEGQPANLRIARNFDGTDLVPTSEEMIDN